jgi:hypothetical protein
MDMDMNMDINMNYLEKVLGVLKDFSKDTELSNVKNITLVINKAVEEINKNKKITGDDKKRLIEKVMIDLIDQTNFGDALEKLDPFFKKMIPELVDAFIEVHDGKLKVNKSFFKKIKVFFKKISDITLKIANKLFVRKLPN